jgi:ABC-type amino acid transport substrate-binding protein
LWDLLAIGVLLAYIWTIRYTERGAADPVWTAIEERGVLRVGTDPGFKPFALERDGQLQGYDIDLVTELAQRIGLRVEFVPVGYDALYDALSTRRVDLLAAALPLAPEQGWRARFSTPYLNAGQVLLLRRDGPVDPRTPQLGGATIGVALGSDGDSYARQLRTRDASITVRSAYETPLAAVAALDRGDVDAVITDSVSALAAQQRYRNVEIAPDALTFDPFVLAVPIEAYLLEREVNRALAEMRRDGVFDRLNARWFQPQLIERDGS